MKQKTKVVCDHNNIVFEKDVTITTKELKKFDCLVAANIEAVASAEQDLGLQVSVLQKNAANTAALQFKRRCPSPIEKEDFDSFEEAIKKFMNWFTQKRLPEELSAEKEQLKKSFEDCKMRAVITLMQLASLLEELHSLNARIFGYEKSKSEVPNDAQEA